MEEASTSLNKKSTFSTGGGLSRRPGGEFNVPCTEENMESFALGSFNASSFASVDLSMSPSSHVFRRNDATIGHGSTLNETNDGFSSSLNQIMDMNFEQLDDILRFEERLRYNYIILKRIQFKYSIVFCLLIAWSLNSIIQVYITGSKWHTRFLYISCGFIALFFITGFYRDKIERPAKFIERTSRVLKMYHMKLSAESHGFLDFTPPIPDHFRHQLREHRLQRRQKLHEHVKHPEKSLDSLKNIFRSSLSR